MNAVPRLWRFGDPIEPLADLLDRGGFLAVPTGSSYGLAADPRSAAGVEAIYRAKGRPAEKALPVVAADESQLVDLGVVLEVPGMAAIRAGWPGPLTAILPLTGPIAASADRDTLAVRIPGHPPLRALLRALGRPLTATSANRSGEAPVFTAEAALALLGDTDGVVVDGGVLSPAAPSTLVRPGPGGLEVIRQGRYVVDEGNLAPRSVHGTDDGERPSG